MFWRAGREKSQTPGLVTALALGSPVRAAEAGRFIPTSYICALSQLSAKSTQLSLGVSLRRRLFLQSSTQYPAGHCFPTCRGKTPGPPRPCSQQVMEESGFCLGKSLPSSGNERSVGTQTCLSVPLRTGDKPPPKSAQTTCCGPRGLVLPGSCSLCG